jgi:hypothetical protein
MYLRLPPGQARAVLPQSVRDNFLSSFPERAVVLGSDNQRAGDAVSGRVSAATVILALDVPGHNSSSSREKTARSCRPSSPSNRRAWALSHRLVTDLR